MPSKCHKYLSTAPKIGVFLCRTFIYSSKSQESLGRPYSQFHRERHLFPAIKPAVRLIKCLKKLPQNSFEPLLLLVEVVPLGFFLAY